MNTDTDTTPANTTTDTGAPTAFYDLATGTVRFRPRDASAPNLSELAHELRTADASELSERVDE